MSIRGGDLRRSIVLTCPKVLLLLFGDWPLPSEVPLANAYRAIPVLGSQTTDRGAIRGNQRLAHKPTIPDCNRVRQ